MHMCVCVCSPATRDGQWWPSTENLHKWKQWRACMGKCTLRRAQTPQIIRSYSAPFRSTVHGFQMSDLISYASLWFVIFTLFCYKFMFTRHAGVCAEAERGADKHVRLLRLTISLLSEGNSCVNSCGLCMEHIYTWQRSEKGEKANRCKMTPETRLIRISPSFQ